MLETFEYEFKGKTYKLSYSVEHENLLVVYYNGFRSSPYLLSGWGDKIEWHLETEARILLQELDFKGFLR